MSDQRSENIKKIKESVQYSRVATFGLGFIVLGAIFYHIVEKLSWLDSIYFTVITLATVGYGDIVPKTAAGKIFTIFYVFVGIVIFIAIARIVLASIVERRFNRKSDKK